MQAQATPSPLAGLIEGRAITTNTTHESPVEQAIREQSDLGILMQGIVDKPRQDFVTPANQLQLDPEGFVFGDNIMRPSELAASQLCNRLSPGLNTTRQAILAAQDDRKGDRRIVFRDFLNHLLTMSDKTFLVRGLQNGSLRARAVLSNAFLAIDDDFVFGTALPIITDSSRDFHHCGGYSNDRGTYAKFIEREPAFTVHDHGKTRDFHIGFILKNSEVGQGFAEFQAFVSDAFCFNGCIFSQRSLVNAKWMHRGSKITTDFPTLLGEDVWRSRVQEHVTLIERATQTAISSNGREEIRKTIQDAVDAPAGSTPTETAQVVRQLGDTLKLPEDATEAILRLSGAESATRFGVQAAVTKYAQDLEPESRIEYEAHGGRILSDDKLWKAVTRLS